MGTAVMNILSMNALVDRVLTHASAVEPISRPKQWSEQEDTFLRENLGWMTDAEIGETLGRSEVAVHLRWSRDLLLPSPSRNPDVITAHQAAMMLGIDGHKIAHWVDMGLIPGRLMAGGRKIRLIRRVALMMWVFSPKNWMYFDIENVTDPKLKRMLKLRAKRWGDAWWSAREVADFHGVDTREILRYVKLGRIHSFRLPVSLGGRHEDRKWSNHFFLRSEAVNLQFCKGKGCAKKSQHYQQRFTPRADAWLLKARDELGMTFLAIGRKMKIGNEKVSGLAKTRTNPTIAYRYRTLCAINAKAGKKRGHTK